MFLAGYARYYCLPLLFPLLESLKSGQFLKSQKKSDPYILLMWTIRGFPHKETKGLTLGLDITGTYLRKFLIQIPMAEPSVFGSMLNLKFKSFPWNTILCNLPKISKLMVIWYSDLHHGSHL